MSKLKVNELDTESGTTITVAAGKTIAGTDIIGSTQIAANAVDTSEIAANAVTLAEMAGLARGKLIVGDASGDPSALTVGTADQVLQSDGSDAAWVDLSTGTSWQAVQTASFTAVAGNGYPCNTTASAFTMTLPASASVGDTIEVVDYAGTFATNNLTLGNNGLNIKGDAGNKTLKVNRLGLRIVYADATQGWVTATSSTSEAIAPLSYNVHWMCVAGGGGGSYSMGGGGGAGGLEIPIIVNLRVVVVLRNQL